MKIKLVGQNIYEPKENQKKKYNSLNSSQISCFFDLKRYKLYKYYYSITLFQKTKPFKTL